MLDSVSLDRIEAFELAVHIASGYEHLFHQIAFPEFLTHNSVLFVLALWFQMHIFLDVGAQFLVVVVFMEELVLQA